MKTKLNRSVLFRQYLEARAMEQLFVGIDKETRRSYEHFFFERICSMYIANREDLTIPLPQIEGLFFTSVQDTVERLTLLSGRLSKFQWRNCIFAPINNTIRPRDIYDEIFRQLKAKVPSLFVRSYVYLIFIKLDITGTSQLDFGDSLREKSVQPKSDDFQIYYWNTRYEVRPGRKTNLFGSADLDSDLRPDENNVDIEDAESSEEANDPKKLFIVDNPAHELQRIQDANSDIIDAFRAYNNKLPLVTQTQTYLQEIAQELDNNASARVLVEGPARSGKTVLAMTLLAKYPKSKMLLMNWYFYEALKDAFKIWAELPKDEIEKLFSMPKNTASLIGQSRLKAAQFESCAVNQRVLEVALKAINYDLSDLPKWRRYVDGKVSRMNVNQRDRDGEWRVTPIIKSAVGDLVPVVKSVDQGHVIQIVQVIEKYDDGSCTVEQLAQIPPFEKSAEQHEWLLEYKRILAAGQGSQYIATLLKQIADALHESDQRFFHHNISIEEGCWIKRGNPTECAISKKDLLICDEVQRLGVIPEFRNRDRFDEVRAIFETSSQSFLCGDDFQMLNPIYDKGIGAIEQIAGENLSRFKLPDSVGVPAEVGELIRHLLDEHPVPNCCAGFEIKLLYDNDIGLVDLFKADGSIKKHYAIPNSFGFYSSEPYICKTTTRPKDCTPECLQNCTHQNIPMLTEELRSKFKFFCSEAVMPNFVLSAYELISREVESLYLKIPKELNLGVVKQPIFRQTANGDIVRNWKKQHLYVLMTRATVRLAINIEDRALYDYFDRKLSMVRAHG